MSAVAEIVVLAVWFTGAWVWLRAGWEVIAEVHRAWTQIDKVGPIINLELRRQRVRDGDELFNWEMRSLGDEIHEAAEQLQAAVIEEAE